MALSTLKSLRDVYALFIAKDEKEIIEMLQEEKLLQPLKKCSKCRNMYKLAKNKAYKGKNAINKVTLRYLWQCRVLISYFLQVDMQHTARNARNFITLPREVFLRTLALLLEISLCCCGFGHQMPV